MQELEGTILEGKYRLVSTLGAGGMGVVYLAQHLQLDQCVAVKVLRSQLGEAARRRFLREAKLAAKLRGEHVARVLDFSTTDPTAPYLVLDFLEGQDLLSLVDRRGALPHEEVVDYLLQALLGVGEAHALGIIHRDLKPSNLFLARGPDGEERVKVMDFGLSKSIADGFDNSSSITNSQVFMGTPAYCAPEMMTSARQADPRSDIWSIGVTAYKLLSGVLPFSGEHVPAFLAAVVAGNVKPLRSVNPKVPKGLAAVVHRCLAIAPADRYQDVAELAEALVPFGPAHARKLADRASRTLGRESGVLVARSSRPSIPERPSTPARALPASVAKLATAGHTLTGDSVVEPIRTSAPPPLAASMPPEALSWQKARWAAGAGGLMAGIGAVVLVASIVNRPAPQTITPAMASERAPVELIDAAYTDSLDAALQGTRIDEPVVPRDSSAR